MRAVISAESSAAMMPSLSVLHTEPSRPRKDAPALSSPANPNQGEKLRTELDITHAERAHQVTEALVNGDVNSAYVTVASTIELLKPYRDKYLKLAKDIRDTMEFSYQRGQAALLDYLDAQRDYRATYVAYLNLVGSYLTAASQLNLAVGREIVQ